MATEIRVDVNLSGQQAYKTINEIERNYNRLKRLLEKQITIRVDGTKGVNAEIAVLRKLQEEYDRLHVAEGKRRSAEAREAMKGYQERAREEEKFLKQQQKIQAEYDRQSLKNRQLENQAILGQLKQRAQAYQQDLKDAKKIQAEYDKISESNRKMRESAKQGAMQDFLIRAKDAEQFEKSAKQIQAAYDAISNANAKLRQTKAQNAMRDYLIRAEDVQAFEQSAKKIQEEYDRISEAKRKAAEADKKEAFKGYLERVKDIEKETAAIEKLTAARAKMGKEIGTVNTSQAKSYSDMAGYIRQIEGLENATVKATGVVRNAAGAFQTYQVSSNNADGSTQRFRISVDEASGKVYQLDQGLVQTSSGATQFGSAIAKAGKSLLNSMKRLVGFYGVVQSLRYAFTEMKSMSDEMIVYQKVTKATATEMERLRDASYDVAKRYGQTPTDFLSAAQEMARAGYKDQSAAMAELAIKTKLVGDITAEQASKFLLAVDAGYKYGGSIEKLSLVLDMANEVGNNYATSIDKISEGMTLVASLAAQANIPIEQLIAALGTMTATTQRSGSEMARALRFTILGILGDTTTEVEEGITVSADEVNSITTALQHYVPEVVNAAKATGELINPMEAIGALAKAYREGLIKSKDELFQISKAIAGQRYYNAFAALIENWDNMYLEMLDKEREALGSADAEINVLMQGWTQKLNKLKTTWIEVVNRSVQEGFIKDLIDGATAALEFAGSLENLAATAGGALIAIKSLTAGIQRYQAINAMRMGQGASKIGFGSAMGALGWAGVAVGIASTIYGIVSSQQASLVQAAKDAAVKAASDSSKAVSNSGDLFYLIERYKALAEDGIDTSELEEVKSLQEQIRDIIGEQATNYDLVNGNLQNNIRLLKQQNVEYLQKKAVEAAVARSEAGIALANVANNKYNALTGKGYHVPEHRIKQSEVTPEIWNYLVKNFVRVGKYGQDKSTWDAEIGLNVGGNPINTALAMIGINPDYNNVGAESVVRTYQQFKRLQELYVQAYTQEQLGSNAVYKDITGFLEYMGPSVEAYLQTQRNENIANANLLLAQNDFSDKTFKSTDALSEYVDALSEANGLTEEQRDALYEAATALARYKENAKGAAEEATSGVEGETDAVNRLTQSIHDATEAKKKFDEAMKSTKADAMGDYATAYSTLETEIKEGRVNSTAFYAAARMLMGDEAFRATGGTSAGVMAALQASGESGSLMDAMKILNATYKDKEGNVVQGYGIYQLLTQTKGVDASSLISAEGNIMIPNFTEDQIAAISKQWGGIDPTMLAAWFNAFDQYDVNGGMTKDVESAMGESAQSAADSVAKMGAAAMAAAAAATALADAAQVTAEQLGGGDGNEEKTKDKKAYPGQVEEAIANMTPEDKTDLVLSNRASAPIGEEALDAAVRKIFNDATVSAQQVNEAMADAAEKSLDISKGVGEAAQSATETANMMEGAGDASERVADGMSASADGAAEVSASISNAKDFADGVESAMQDADSASSGAADSAGDAEKSMGAASSDAAILSKHIYKAGQDGERIGDGLNASQGYAQNIKNAMSESAITGAEIQDKIDGAANAADDVSGSVKKASEDAQVVSAGFDSTKESAVSIEGSFGVSRTGAADIAENLASAAQASSDIAGNLGGAAGSESGTPPTTGAEAAVPSGNGAEETQWERINRLLGLPGTSGSSEYADAVMAVYNAMQNKNGSFSVPPGMTQDDLNVFSEYARAIVDYYQAIKESVEIAKEADEAAQQAGEAIRVKPFIYEDYIKENWGLSTDQDIIDFFNGIMEDLRENGRNEPWEYYDPVLTSRVGEGGQPMKYGDWQVLVDMVNAAYDRLNEAAEVQVDTSEAEAQMEDFADKASEPIVIPVQVYDANGAGGGGSPIGGVTSLLSSFFGLHYATGTRSHPGGPALVNDGAGPELIVDRGNAFIAGGGNPAIVSLHRGAKVFTAGQTSAMLGGRSVPAYAEGTTGGIDWASFIAAVTGYKPGDVTEDKGSGEEGEKNKGGSGSGGPKVDKESYAKLQTLMNYILNRLNTALEEQTEIIDKQIDALQKEREVQQEQDKLEELQKNLSDALNERTVRYLGEDGKWHWMADANKVQKAQEELTKYQEELEFNAKIDALEQQKTDLQNELNEITKVWQQIQDAVETPTGDINELLAAVLANGTDPQKKAAEYIQNLLIGNMIGGSSYSGNYAEALTALQAATAGSPFMPTELSYTLASLIANTGAHESVGDVTESLMQSAGGVLATGANAGNVYGMPTTNYNYYINGLELGSDQANRPLSDILQDLTVYTNATVH